MESTKEDRREIVRTVIVCNTCEISEAIEPMDYLRETLERFGFDDPVFQEVYAITTKTKLFVMAMHEEYHESSISLIVMFAKAGCRGIREISTNENFFHFFTLLKDRNASPVCTAENLLLCLSMITDFEVPPRAIEYAKTSNFWNVMRPILHARVDGAARFLANIIPTIGTDALKIEIAHIIDFTESVIMESETFTAELLAAWKIMNALSYVCDSPVDDLSLIMRTIEMYKTLGIESQQVSQTMCEMVNSVRQKPRTVELLSVMTVILDTDDSSLASLLDQYFMHSEEDVLFEFFDGMDEDVCIEFLEKLIEQSNYIETSDVYALMSLVAIFVARTQVTNRSLAKLCKRMKHETECKFLVDQIMSVIRLGSLDSSME